ncbi:uncharacterized protein I206_100272 [Kwoniella pini CBS 10737]|uniref:Uncharacterized protein n=1 Tax=Kwoniella pini CBS 10737 TaxID=1296096 RepID=A0A1B9IDX1_9TREE|nr:uncharacterized protein I206_01053 [Kwoniella pini CBS 10737]OCF53746.1 hypothetical protein I206_01053 [Kwoniella pini CBS 10737]
MSSGMYETTVGSLSHRKLDYPFNNSTSSPFTDTLIFKPTSTTNRSYSPRQSIDNEMAGRKSNERRSPVMIDSASAKRRGRKEELESEDESSSIDEEMDELSDSRSSHTSSRPMTPSQPQQQPIAQIPHSRSQPHTRPIQPPDSDSKSPEGIFTLAHKAERILGLIPGTIGYAKACLENAKDEIKRLSESNLNENYTTYSDIEGKGGEEKRKIQNRARKAISFTGFPNYHQNQNNSLINGNGKVPNVVIGLGNNKEEEEKREKRRKAADGIVYWQREIQRLEREERERGTRN